MTPEQLLSIPSMDLEAVRLESQVIIKGLEDWPICRMSTDCDLVSISEGPVYVHYFEPVQLGDIFKRHFHTPIRNADGSNYLYVNFKILREVDWAVVKEAARKKHLEPLHGGHWYEAHGD